MNSKMTVCKTCGTEIAKTAKSCPKCGAKNSKPIFLRPWFIIIIVLALLIGAKTIIDSSNASSFEIDGKTYSANDIIKNGNSSVFLDKYCVVYLEVDEVIGNFNKILGKDQAEIWCPHNAAEYYNASETKIIQIMESLNSGDKIKVTGRIDFVGTMQVVVDDVQSIEIVK